jgi:hypothetical protein
MIRTLMAGSEGYFSMRDDDFAENPAGGFGSRGLTYQVIQPGLSVYQSILLRKAREDEDRQIRSSMTFLVRAWH